MSTEVKLNVSQSRGYENVDIISRVANNIYCFSINLAVLAHFYRFLAIM